MRNAYEPPPWLAPLNTPKVSATVGLGTGGGAAVQTEDSGGFGSILVYAGTGFNPVGSVTLQFPNTPPTLFISADAEFGPGQVTQATVGNQVTISWNNAAFILPRSVPYKISYEWSTSS